MDNRYLYPELSEKILKAFWEVVDNMPVGLLEKVYEKALCHELKTFDINYKEQYPLQVTYKGETVGDFIADLVVEDKIIIELKAVEELSASHKAQLINYLAITGIKIGYLLNFGTNRRYERCANPNINRKVMK